MYFLHSESLAEVGEFMYYLKYYINNFGVISAAVIKQEDEQSK